MSKATVFPLIFLVFVVLLLPPISALAKFEIKEDIDKFEGWIAIDMRNTEKIDIKDFSDCLELYAIKITLSGKEAEYFLCVYYHSSHPLFIEDGVSLLLKVDGELFEFATAGRPNTDVEYGGNVTESASYKVEPEFLWKISNAEEIEVRVKGKYNLDGKFKDELFEQYKEFCEYCGIAEE